MKLALAFLFVAYGPLAAQVPRAEPVDPTLSPDAGNDFFQRGKNLYDTANASTVPQNRVEYFQRAAQIFADYLSAFPNHANAEIAWWYLGNSYYQSGQIDDGKRCFSTLLNRYGTGKWAGLAAYTLAADHYNKGEYAFAVPLFEKFAENAPKPEERPRGYYFAGLCYRYLGRDREAIGAFKKVIGDPAGSLFAAQAKLGLGSLSLKAGNLQEALAQFEEIVASPYAVKYRGEAALQAALTATRLDKQDLADKYLQLILNTAGMDEFRPDAQTALMENLLSRKQYREVIDVFQRSSTKASGEKEGARLMIAGRAYLGLKRPTEALQLFRDVEKLVKPELDLAFRASYFRLLCFFQIEGRHVPDQVDAFLQLYQKSRAQDPLIHMALLFKAETLFANNQSAEAAKVYSQINAALVTDDVRPGLFYKRGWCLAEAGDQQGAVRSLTEFITKYPDDSRVPSALAKRAKAFAESAEPAKAVADFDRLIAAKGTQTDLISFGWLESARLRRGEGNIPDMIVRYKGLLQNVKDLGAPLESEANYFIGWGLWKNNAVKDAVPYLEKARTLQPDTYKKNAGVLLALGYFSAQDPAKLAAEINLAIEGKYIDDIPDPALQWAGMQAIYANDYASAAKFLALVANPSEPRETPKEVWRYLAKARLQIGDAEGALAAANNVLAVEDNPGWKADGLLDRGRALFLLKRFEESRVSADEALALHPQGHTSAGLNILDGDLKLNAGDPSAAAGKYEIVVQFHVDDKELKPLALSKLVAVLEQQGDKALADKYRTMLQTEFPNWKTTGN